MSQIRCTVPAFVGGAEVVYDILYSDRYEAGGAMSSLDLTDYTITAEVWWEGCRQIGLSVGSGIVIINPTPADMVAGEYPTDFHHSLTLSETQTRCIPIGRSVAFLKLIRVSPDGVTTIRAPIWLNRVA